MSEHQTIPYPEIGYVPEIELRHRLRLALDVAAIGTTEMAEHLGVSTGTIRNYLKGRTHPTRSTIRDWSMRCGVSYDWLEFGASGWLSGTAA